MAGVSLAGDFGECTSEHCVKDKNARVEFVLLCTRRKIDYVQELVQIKPVFKDSTKVPLKSCHYYSYAP